jgi:hypothetical protein
MDYFASLVLDWITSRAMKNARLTLSPERLRTGLLAFALVAVFVIQILAVVRREVMTTDEGYHTYAGFRYWECADFGVNPEHPPLAKIIAAFPLFVAHTPAPVGPCPVTSTLKGVGYGDSDAWYYGSSTQPARVHVDRVIWRARLIMSLFAVALALTAFFFTRRLFGDASALVALALIAFEPTLIAHGALVTTDIALSKWSARHGSR